MNGSSIDKKLSELEAVEANIVKLEKIWQVIENLIPLGMAFYMDYNKFEENASSFNSIFRSLPKINGWKPNIDIMSPNDIISSLIDAHEIGEKEAFMSVNEEIYKPRKLLREFKLRFIQEKKKFIRNLIDKIDKNLLSLKEELKNEVNSDKEIFHPYFEEIKGYTKQIEKLLGTSASLPKRWEALRRHLSFGLIRDLKDIINVDWPEVYEAMKKELYGENEPIPVEVDDLASLIDDKPREPVATKISWSKLSPEQFERLIYNLISSSEGYENPEWLMETNAPDRGRDLSVYRVLRDSLSGQKRKRVIIQCKCQRKNVSPGDVTKLRDLMKLWDPPKVDILIIATTGKFTSDAVSLIEKHNNSDAPLEIEMWPDTHLEKLLASRPAIIAEFSLK